MCKYGSTENLEQACISTYRSLRSQSSTFSTHLNCVTDCDLNKTAYVCCSLFMVHLKTARKNVLQHVKIAEDRGHIPITITHDYIDSNCQDYQRHITVTLVQ